MKKICTLFALCLALLAWSPVSARAIGPQETVKQALDKVIVILENPDSKDAKGYTPETYAQIREIIRGVFDFRELSSRTVGRPWLELSPAQQNEFTETFTQLLERTYLRRVEEYNKEQVEYLKELVQEDRAMVMTDITYEGKKIPVNYRLKKMDAGWMVYDVSVEGVSLVKNYRTQFRDILQNGTAEDLLQRIKDKVAQLKETGDTPEQ